VKDLSEKYLKVSRTFFFFRINLILNSTQLLPAQDIDLKNHFYAVKREPLDLDHPQLHHENMIYDVLAGGPCIPQCHWYGQYDGFDCIVIDLLGSSLKDLQQCTRNIPLDIIIDIGCQLVSCMEHIHDRGLVYRDIKPENFLFSSNCVFSSSVSQQAPQPQQQQQKGNSSSYSSPPPSPPLSTNNDNSQNNVLNNWDHKIYIVDFGLTTWWRNPKTKKPFGECKKPIKYKTGTARYASLNVHRGRTHARRDDMESLGYLLLDLLLNGELPWSGITARTSKAGWDRLGAIKEEILLQDLCLGLPHGIMDFISYTRNLRFNDRPDYDYLRRLLLGCCSVGGPYSKIVTLPLSNATRFIPSPPKSSYNNYNGKNNNHNYIKRRNSISHHYYQQQSKNNHHYQPQQHQQHQQQQEDVFIMDDLLKELPPLPSSSPGNNTAATKHHSNSSSSHYYNNNKRYHYSNSSNSRQFTTSNKKQFAGWNTHKNYTPAAVQQQWE
jgi:serine/threonine protein kinase